MKLSCKSVMMIFLVLSLMVVLVGCGDNATPAPEPVAADGPNVGDAPDASAENNDGEAKIFRAGTPGMHYPWNFMENDELTGIDIDILTEVGRRIGYQVEFEIVEFSGLFGLIDNGKVDTGACQVTVTPVRLETYTFSDDYAFSFYKLAVREDDDSINSVADLIGKTFISQPARVEAEFMEQYISENGLEDQINLLISDADPFMEISLGRADATFYPELMFEEKNEEGQFNLKLVGEVIGEEAHAYPFRQDVDPEFLVLFNNALAEMRADGFMTEVFIKYLGSDISESAL